MGYTGFGSKVTIGDDGIRTEITIANKVYPAEKIISIIDSVEEDIKEIEKKLGDAKTEQEKKIKQLIIIYRQTPNQIDKLKLLNALVEIGANLTTITVNLIDIKNKLVL